MKFAFIYSFHFHVTHNSYENEFLSSGLMDHDKASPSWWWIVFVAMTLVVYEYRASIWVFETRENEEIEFWQSSLNEWQENVFPWRESYLNHFGPITLLYHELSLTCLNFQGNQQILQQVLGFQKHSQEVFAQSPLNFVVISCFINPIRKWIIVCCSILHRFSSLIKKFRKFRLQKDYK